MGDPSTPRDPRIDRLIAGALTVVLSFCGWFGMRLHTSIDNLTSEVGKLKLDSKVATVERDRLKAVETIVAQIRDEQQRRTGRVYDVKELRRRLEEHMAVDAHSGARKLLRDLDRRLDMIEARLARRGK